MFALAARLAIVNLELDAHYYYSFFLATTTLLATQKGCRDGG